jgi:hypothetical protein
MLHQMKSYAQGTSLMFSELMDWFSSWILYLADLEIDWTIGGHPD